MSTNQLCCSTQTAEKSFKLAVNMMVGLPSVVTKIGVAETIYSVTDTVHRLRSVYARLFSTRCMSAKI